MPLVYSQEVLTFTEQCHQQSDVIQLPTDTVNSTAKQELGNRNLHAEEDFSQKVERLTPPQVAQPHPNESSGLTPPKPAHVAPIDAP